MEKYWTTSLTSSSFVICRDSNSALHPSATVPKVADSWSLVQSGAAQKLLSQLLIGGIQDELATVDRIATVPGIFRQVEAGEVRSPVKVFWQDCDRLEETHELE